jgi:23S rRNA (adenine1618-N6)-methyltransferase
MALHARNPHSGKYDFTVLTQVHPELKPFVALNKYGNESIDFAEPAAVKALNKALLKSFYKIDNWDIPEGYLCPPIPGRAEYIHRVAELIEGKKDARVLDVGIGANAIYPIIGISEYGWNFVGSDIDTVALESAAKIIDENPSLKGKVELREQKDSSKIFEGIVSPYEYFDLAICNPPFHSSSEDASFSSLRKRKNLGIDASKPLRNFGGQNNELWCEGGEEFFIHNMVLESQDFKARIGWFSTLVSKETTLRAVFRALKKTKCQEVRKMDFSIGQKNTRVIAWRF